MNYYNESNPEAAFWLRELIRVREIPDGLVDTRSICEVRPHELTNYVQHHFFAGIGGWPLALQLAGWPDDQPVRTGSCPCQPFSQTGKQLGTKDARHLWPFFRDLITFGDSTITFGEQVASPLGREWLSGIRADLEGLGYEVGAADLCAAGVGAPHIRQRLYWMAHPKSKRRTGMESECEKGISERPRVGGDSAIDRLGNPNGEGLQGRNERIFECDHQWPLGTPNLVVCCEDGKARRFEPGSFPLAHGVSGRVGLLRGYGNAIVPQLAAEFIQACEEVISTNP